MILRRALGLLRHRSGLAAALVAATLAGCGATPPKAKAPARPARVVKSKSAQPGAPEGPPMLPAHVIAELDSEDASPYFARRGNEALLLYAAGGRWWTRRIGADGAPAGEKADAGPAAEDVPAASLRAVASGYLLAWVESSGKNRAIKVLALDAAGKTAGPATLILQSAEEVTWVDVFPNAKGAIVIWDIPRDDRADVMMSAIHGGKPSAPVAIARDALGWQAVGTERGAAVAIVRRPPGAGAAPKGAGAEEDAKLGQVALLEMDATGKLSPDVVVSPQLTAQIDIEIVAVNERYVLAWTDERDLDASVHVAVVEPGGKVAVAPRRATPPAGEQALVSLVAAPYAPGGPAAAAKRALLAWEDLIRAPQEGRVIHLATLGPDGVLGKDRAALIFSSNGPPDFAVDGDGFAAVTLAPAAAQGAQNPAPDDKAPIWPTYVRFGPDLSVRAAEPIRAAPFAANNGVPYLVRGLTCNAGACTTLASAAAGESHRAPLALVSLPVRQSVWRAPALHEDADALPRASAVTALYDGDHLARVAATDLGGGKALSAWVTYYLEGSDEGTGKKDLSATLGVRAVGPDGLGKINLLSQKAWSLGGVAIAASTGEKRESMLAWVAREKSESQVYVTKLDAAGEKISQKKLTVVPRKKRQGVPNEASDVAISGDGGDGWVVAWVDTRDGNAEVYAARVDGSLTKTVPDQRISDAAGDAAEVQVLSRGKEVWLVWSDARQAGEEGSGDIYLARLDAKSLRKVGSETRLFASPEHSRSPSITPFGSGMVTAWVEEPANDSPGGGSVRIAYIDDKGILVGAPVLLRGPGGAAVSSVAIACDKACRGVLASSAGDALSLNGFEFTPGGAVSAVKPLGSLTGSSTQDVSPVFAGAGATSLFFADDALGGSGRVRWMTLAWP